MGHQRIGDTVALARPWIRGLVGSTLAHSMSTGMLRLALERRVAVEAVLKACRVCEHVRLSTSNQTVTKVQGARDTLQSSTKIPTRQEQGVGKKARVYTKKVGKLERQGRNGARACSLGHPIRHLYLGMLLLE